MAKKETTADTECLRYAGLALLAEQAGDYESAAEQWRRASGLSSRPDRTVLYEEAAKRCERRSKENPAPAEQ